MEKVKVKRYIAEYGNDLKKNVKDIFLIEDIDKVIWYAQEGTITEYEAMQVLASISLKDYTQAIEW